MLERLLIIVTRIQLAVSIILVINVLSFPIFMNPHLKKVLMNIHEYANELICIFEYQLKRQCLSLHLVSILSNYDEYRVRYEQFTMCTVLIKCVFWVAMETVRFHIAQMSFEFFLEDFFLSFSGFQGTILHP